MINLISLSHTRLMFSVFLKPPDVKGSGQKLDS